MEEKIIYARINNPEHFNYLFWNADFDNCEELVIESNEFEEVHTELLKSFYRFYDIYDCWDFDTFLKNNYDNKIEKFIISYFKNDIKDIEHKDLTNFINALNSGEQEDMKVEYLSLRFNKPFVSREIKGCSQRDYASLFISKDKEDNIPYYEALYWNTGTEIEVHDEDYIPCRAEDISGYLIYTELRDIDKIKKLIKSHFTGNIKLVLYEYDYTIVHREDVYKLEEE